MSDETERRSWVPDLKAFVILSWGWVVVAALAAVTVILVVPQLPSVVTLIFPGLRGSGSTAYAVPSSAVVLASVIVVVVFAAIVLVFRLMIAPRRWWIALVLILLDALVIIAASAVVISVLGQLGRTDPLGTSPDATSPLTFWIIAAAYLVIAVVLASGLFVSRRLTLGRWRALR